MPNLKANTGFRRAGVLLCGAWGALVLGTGSALASGGGLPQLDPHSFPPQLVWLAITFGALYYLMSNVAVPRISEVLEARQERITVDLEKAQSYKDESTAVIAAYERALADANAEALGVVAATVAETDKVGQARQAEFMAALNERVKAAENRIVSARESAMANVRTVAAEAAVDIVSRLADIKVDRAKADKAVDTVVSLAKERS